MNIRIIKADYLNSDHSTDLIHLLDSYARDPMGGGTSLSQYVIDNLATEMSKIPHAISFIAYVNDEPAGLINCFEAFSTFSCKPLINIHDVIVIKEYRGHGLSQKMLAKVEEHAKEMGCCKLTLEVLSNNTIAKNSYSKYGFENYELDPRAGNAMFMQKVITTDK